MAYGVYGYDYYKQNYTYYLFTDDSNLTRVKRILNDILIL